MKITVLLLGVMMLTSCDTKTQSLECYKTHHDERNVKVKYCNKKSELRKTEDCRNALDASFLVMPYTRDSHKAW